MKPERTRRLWPPLLVTIASIAILIGCIPIPAFNHHAGPGPRPDRLIGKRPTSDKPLAIGRSTLANVEVLFGRNVFDTPDTVYVHRYSVISYYIVSICGVLDLGTDDRWLVIRFGPDGTIADYDTYSSEEAVRKALGGNFQRHRPTTQELEDAREYWTQRRAAATKRATQPAPSR